MSGRGLGLPWVLAAWSSLGSDSGACREGGGTWGGGGKTRIKKGLPLRKKRIRKKQVVSRKRRTGTEEGKKNRDKRRIKLTDFFFKWAFS